MGDRRGIWTQYVASQDHPLPDSVTRVMRLAFGGFTWLIKEEWDYSGGPLPSAGYRPPSFSYLPNTRHMKARPGDWVVEGVALYRGGEGAEYEAIAVCTCRYDPIAPNNQEWRDVRRGTPMRSVDDDPLLPVSPGEVLAEEFMAPAKISARQLAESLGVPVRLVNGVIKARRKVTPDLADRLAKRFNVSAEFWLNLQSRYLDDLRQQNDSTFS